MECTSYHKFLKSYLDFSECFWQNRCIGAQICYGTGGNACWAKSFTNPDATQGSSSICQTEVSLPLPSQHTRLPSLLWDGSRAGKKAPGAPDHRCAVPESFIEPTPHNSGAATNLRISCPLPGLPAGPGGCHVSMISSLKSEPPGGGGLDRSVTRPLGRPRT